MTVTRKAAILIAEDSDFDRMILKRAFAAADLDVALEFVGDGEELLHRLRASAAADSETEQPGIVLLDLHMPRMNGREALRAIREDDRLRHLPIVMLTTSNNESHIREFYNLGANSYVVKPNSFDDLVTTVRELRSYWFGIVRLPGTETQ